MIVSRSSAVPMSGNRMESIESSTSTFSSRHRRQSCVAATTLLLCIIFFCLWMHSASRAPAAREQIRVALGTRSVGVGLNLGLEAWVKAGRIAQLPNEVSYFGFVMMYAGSLSPPRHLWLGFRVPYWALTLATAIVPWKWVVNRRKRLNMRPRATSGFEVIEKSGGTAVGSERLHDGFSSQRRDKA